MTHGISLTPVPLQGKELRMNMFLKAQLEKSYKTIAKAKKLISFINNDGKVTRVFYDNENINIIVYKKLHPDYQMEVEELKFYEPKSFKKEREKKEEYELELRIIREEHKKKRELYLKETVRIIIDEREKVYYDTITQAARAIKTTIPKIYKAMMYEMPINGHYLKYKTIKKKLLAQSDYVNANE